MGAISSFIADVNRRMGGMASRAVTNLQRNGYMSPPSSAFTGQGFACANCDYAKRSERMKELHRDKEVLYCNNPDIQAYIEKNGCCNRFTFRGVSA